MRCSRRCSLRTWAALPRPLCKLPLSKRHCCTSCCPHQADIREGHGRGSAVCPAVCRTAIKDATCSLQGNRWRHGHRPSLVVDRRISDSSETDTRLRYACYASRQGRHQRVRFSSSPLGGGAFWRACRLAASDSLLCACAAACVLCASRATRVSAAHARGDQAATCGTTQTPRTCSAARDTLPRACRAVADCLSQL